MRKVLALCIVIILASCQEQKSPTTLSLKANEPAEVSVYSIVDDIHFELTEQDTISEINITKGTFLSLSQIGGSLVLYAKPEEQLVLDTISSNPIIYGVSQNVSPENTFLEDYDVALKSQDPRELYKYYPKKADSFKLLVKAYNAPLLKKLDELKTGEDFDENFKSAMLKRISLDLVNPLVSYEGIHKRLTNSEAEISEDFYADFEAIDLKEESYLNFDNSLSKILSWVIKGSDFTKVKTIEDFHAVMNSKLDSVFGDSTSTFKDYYNQQFIQQSIANGLGIDENMERIEAFRKETSNKAIVSLLNGSTAPWEKLTAGKKAPNFTGKTTDDTIMSLDDFKGKKVYIDVWATWCKPCIAEIPALKQLEEEFKDENIQFLSVSIDRQKDAEKWAKFVAENELGGVQLLTDGEFKSEIVQGYNVQSIPRFLLIDKEGNITHSKAPRPSDPKIKDWLMK